MREVVPSATASLRLLDPVHGDRSVTLASVLPMSWSAMVRVDGSIVLALQTQQRSGNLAVDLGQALLAALGHETSAGITNLALPGVETPSLLELVVSEPLAVEVHQGFDWWLGSDAEVMTEEVAESMTEANESVVPTARLTGVDAAYWCRIGDRRHLRWAMTEDEDALLNALAKLHNRREVSLADGAPYVGAFRTQGILVPVWDLPAEWEAADVEAPAAAFSARLAATLADAEPLTSEERRAKAGVISRQVTLR